MFSRLRAAAFVVLFVVGFLVYEISQLAGPGRPRSAVQVQPLGTWQGVELELVSYQAQTGSGVSYALESRSRKEIWKLSIPAAEKPIFAVSPSGVLGVIQHTGAHEYSVTIYHRPAGPGTVYYLQSQSEAEGKLEELLRNAE